MNLKNKIAVITGASDGIGKHISLRLAKDGVNLALIGRNKKRLKEVAIQAKELGALKIKTYVCDIQKGNDLEKIVNLIISDFSNIDILINNAGIWQKKMSVEEIKKDTVDSVIGTNLTALINVTRLFIPNLKNREEAAIINVVSKSGVVAQEGQSVYSASKYGVRGFTEVLRIDLKDSNIKVAGLYQGGINTDLFKKADDNFSTSDFTEPTDLADVIAYMLSLPKKIWLYDVRVSR
jgi:short-subunit dehydrogenase